MASIAAIAQVELKSRRHEDELGTSVEIEGSETISQEPTSSAPGTSICVKNLFYNTPARRNFLKGNSVEMRHIIDEFQRIALANPEIFFTLHNDGNEVFHLPKGSLKQRIIHLFGNTYNQKLVPVEEKTSIIDLKGYIGKPEFAKKTRGEQFFFVNNRFIKDPYLNHAVMNAFEEVLSSDSFPLYVLFIDIDPAKIDINVHPTKTEIKYQDEKAIYAIIRSAVKRSLGKYNISPTLDFNQETAFGQMITIKAQEDIIPPSIAFNPDFNPFNPGRIEREIPFLRNAGQERQTIDKNWGSLYEIVHPEQARQSGMELEGNRPVEIDKQVLQIFGKQIFQLHNRFIISQIKSGFMLIDQQAAHERILYERYLQHLENRQGACQQSLFPQTVTLNTSDFELVKDLLPDIHALGFQIRTFGKNTFIIDGIPADIGTKINEVEMMEQLIEGYKNNQSNLKLNKRDSLARALARNTSIKSGLALSTDEMNLLIDELFACEMPNTSISGKPVISTFTLEELLQRFEK
jgi:DNA mismatch repair protein MutL